MTDSTTRFTYPLTLGQMWDIYAFAANDVIDLSAIPFSTVPTKPVASMIRAVAHPSGTYSTLQLNPEGGTGTFDWFVIARLDGITAGRALNLINGPAPSLLVTVQSADSPS